MFSELRKRVKKVGQPPGTPVYTGEQQVAVPRITVTTYTEHDFHETVGTRLEECLPTQSEAGITWINIEGLHDIELIKQLATRFNLHALTVEDILNIGQRAKIEEFEDYLFIITKKLKWDPELKIASMEQISLVMGKDFVLSFQERESTLFTPIRERLRGTSNQRLRQRGTDYLTYRLIDTIVDRYFMVLEGIGEQIEEIEVAITTVSTTVDSRSLYLLKRRVLAVRKAIWPMREVLSHLLQAEEERITPFTRLYLRDVYDHAMQSLDTIENFRDMLSSLLDVYLSSLSNRLNEVMKILTIISTIFIPTTFIASIYGMNFQYMPELHWRWGYPTALFAMLVTTVLMIIYFRRKKWI